MTSPEQEIVAEFGAAATVTTSGTCVLGEPPAGEASRPPRPARTPARATAGATGASRQNGTSPGRRRGSSTAWDLARCGSPRPTSTGTTTTAASAARAVDDVRRSSAPPTAPPGRRSPSPRGSTYAGGLAINTYNHLDFEPDRRQAPADPDLGRHGAAARAPACCAGAPTARPSTRSASPVLIRTTIGTVPALPSALDACLRERRSRHRRVHLAGDHPGDGRRDQRRPVRGLRHQRAPTA